MSKANSRSVFIGNIPYGLTEEAIIELFSSAGKVLSLRLVYDRENGRPKGFGFAEYPDADSAASAVRNLNDHEIQGRKLRVDYSASNDDDNMEQNTNMNNQQQQPPIHFNSAPVPPPSSAPQNGSFQLPTGIDLTDGLTCTDSISRTLNTLPPAQLLDVLIQMKQLVATDQTKATELLRQAPQLAYALFQGLLLMGLVSTDALSSVVEQATAPPPVVPVPTPQHQIYPQAPIQGYPPPPPPNYANQPPPHLAQMGTPPVHGMPYPPPPQQYQQAPVHQQRPPPPPAQPAMDPVLLQQVMNMPQEVIDSMAPADRAQFLALRASLGG